MFHLHRTLNRINRTPGFTLFELAVTIAITAILATVFLNRVWFYREQAERVAMGQVVGAIRTALHLQIAALLVKNRGDEIPRLMEQNPMDWLAQKPKNYLGEYYAPKITDIAAGNWYFDRKDKKLVYLLNNKTYLRYDEQN